MAVEEDELARHDDQALLRVTVEGLETAIKQLHKLAGIAACGSITELAGVIESNAGLRGVGDDETNLGLLSECHVGCILAVGIQSTADDVDAFQRVHCLTIQTSLKVHMVQAVLTVEPVNHAALDGLYDDDAAVEVCPGVHFPHNPVDKSTKEVTFAKLNDLLGHHALGCRLLV